MGCGSMSVDDYIENQGDLLPSDFNYREFADLNPDIALMQVMAEISSLNLEWEQGLRVKSPEIQFSDINALKKESEAEFYSDSVRINKIFQMSFNKEMPESFPRLDSLQINKFNLFGRDDELDFIDDYLENHIDTNLVIDTYVLYGIHEGRPYRKCTSKDAKEVEKTPLLSTERTDSQDPIERYYTEHRFCAEVDKNGEIEVIYLIEP